MSTSFDKINRLLVRHPEIKPCFKDKDFLTKYKDYKVLNEKGILITTDPDLWRWYVLPNLLENPAASLREVDMGYVLDVFTGNIAEETSIYDIKADILVIHDGRLKMTHSQKDILLATLWESSPVIIYDWRGDKESFRTKSQLDSSLKGVMLNETGNKISSNVSRTDAELF